jgi:death-on-curing protein
MRDDIAAEYNRIVGQLGEDSEVPGPAVSAHTVLKAHFQVMDFFADKPEGIGGIGPKSLHLLHSAVARQHAGFGSTRKWNDLFEIAATLFYGIIKDHVFHDANKRTALLTALFQLDRSGRTPEVAQKDFEVLAVRVAKDRLDEYPAYTSFSGRDDPEVRFIARQFRRMTREIDNRQYTITFRELDTILHKFGARLSVASGNHIDVLKTVDEPAGFFGTRVKTVEKRIGQVGFKDWGSQVLPSDLKKVRGMLNLTPEYKCDSQVFFRGVDPMQSLVREYAGPLQRLATK